MNTSYAFTNTPPRCFSGADSGQISEETWNFLQSIYGGGPEIILRPPVPQIEPEPLETEDKIELETHSL